MSTPQMFKLPDMRYGFYDFIARFVPGSVFVACSFMVAMGPSSFFSEIARESTSDQLLSTPMLFFWLPIIYFCGTVLGQLWLILEYLLGRIRSGLQKLRIFPEFMRRQFIDLDLIYKKAGVSDYRQRMGKVLHDRGCSEDYLIYTERYPDYLPSTHVMLEQLRSQPSGDAERFLKLRAEERMAEASTMGLALSITVYFIMPIETATESTLVVAALVVALIGGALRAFRQRERFSRGVTFAWLHHFLEMVCADSQRFGRTFSCAFEIKQELRLRVNAYESAVVSIPALSEPTASFSLKDLMTAQATDVNGRFSIGEHMDSIYKSWPALKRRDLLIIGLRNTLVNGRAIAWFNGGWHGAGDEDPNQSLRHYFGIAVRAGRISVEKILPREQRTDEAPDCFVSGNSGSLG